MPKSSNRVLLTSKEINNLKPGDKRYQVQDAEVPKLIVQVDVSGSKIFKVRRSHGGKRTDKTIGDAKSMPIHEARRIAKDLLTNIDQGKGPVRRSDRGACLEDAVKACHAEPRYQHLAESTKQLFEGYLRRLVLPALGSRHIRELTPEDLQELFDEVHTNNGPSAAKGARDALGKVFAYAKRKKLITTNVLTETEVIVKRNKARRERRFPESGIPTLWTFGDRPRSSKEIGEALKFSLLTAARRTEVADATWEEFDLEKRVWIVPTERTKKKVAPYVIPLSAGAMAILAARPECADKKAKVFNVRPDSLTQTMRKLTSKDPFQRVFSPHDLRRTIVYTLAQTFRVPREVRQQVLNHSADRGDALDHYDGYDYQDEKAAALEQWSGFVLALVDADAGPAIC